LNESGLSPVVLPLPPDGLAELVGLVARGEVSRNQAKDVLSECLREPKRPKQVVHEQGLAQVSDEGALAAVVDEVLAANADVVDEWRVGDDKVRGKKRGFLVGEAMKALKGAGNGQVVGRLVDERLQR
jgi:aspartyl-tRNA(Asn)/glutamyl-tRNA(Gln) amidotransferase subunit B